MTTEDQVPPGTGESDPSIAAAEADLRETREELAQTVDELASRLDVKTRSREALDHKKQQVRSAATRLRGRTMATTGRAGEHARASVTDEQGRPTSTVRIGALAAGAAAIGVVVFVVWRRKRR